MNIDNQISAINTRNIISVVGKNCTGCGACAIECLKQCISLQPNEEGFLMPQVDINSCVHCGKCVRICPTQAKAKIEKREPIDAYAATSKIQSETWGSSSGGMFYHAAKCMIEEMHGYVCGAVLDENLILHHIVSNSMDDVARMQGSKYIQSRVDTCYSEIQRLLKQQQNVLFCGTPCQVAGLLSVIGSNDFLYTMDLVCHGVPSNLAFSAYIQKMYGADHFIDVTFRQKNNNIKSSFSYSYYKNKNKKKRETLPAFQDPFYQAFLDGHNYRESCYSCLYAESSRVGDITIGDCGNWRAYSLPTNLVLSTILINTRKGQMIWKAICNDLEYVAADYSQECKLNKQLHAPTTRTAKRDVFYEDIRTLPLEQLQKKYCPHRNLKDKLVYFVLMHTTVQSRESIKCLLKRK